MASAYNSRWKTLFYEDVNGQFVERKSFDSLRNDNTRKAISGNTAVESYHSSTQQVRVYQLQNGTWTQTQTFTGNDTVAGDSFGESVDIEGDLIIVGAYDDDDLGQTRGRAYLFKRGEDGQFSQLRKLNAPDGVANDGFGRHVGISGQSAVVYQSGGGGVLHLFNGLETPEGSLTLY